jgi:hypothetical protein
MFGLLAIVALAVYANVLLLPLSAAIVSGFRCRAVPLYWLLAVASAGLFPVVFRQPLPHRSGGEYGSFGFFIEGAFSATSFVCMGGSVVALILALLNNEFGRLVSAVSWGFLSMAVVRTIQLL